MASKRKRPKGVLFVALAAIVFGAVTIFSGGMILFTEGVARTAAGNVVPFVLWFNFLAGFFYILAGAGIFYWRKWGVSLSALIAVATLLIGAALLFHINAGELYETRTLAAMGLRSVFWVAIATFVGRKWVKK